MIDEARLYPLIGERLRRLREQSVTPTGYLTQAELAKQIGLERTSITNIEKGSQKVPLHILYRLCEILGTKVSDVLPTMGEVVKADEAPVATTMEYAGQMHSVAPRTLASISRILGVPEAS